ncbi:Gfo/Idh/MocA family oxidoreductase [Candidatus Poribacteria bacterium]|nr:Gfo/Idh/MocA family oxidoreductase [Candidatus Poribacteria bacterium]
MVRIGLLGSGFVSEFYMNGLMHVPDQQVVINYSQSEKTARAFAEKWRLPKWTTNMREVVDADVDLVLIGLPNFVHREGAILCAEAKKNVVCTKPLARTAAEAKEMLDAVREAGVLHGYAETEVFSPAVMKAKEAIDAGAIGDVLTVRSREAHIGPHTPWFWDKDLAGGGAILDMGCHCIAAARYFIGKDVPAVSVMAWGDTLYHKSKTKSEDNAVVLVKFRDGQLGQAEVSWSSHGGLDLRNEVYGTDGVLYTDVTRGTPIRAFTLKGMGGHVVEKAESETGWVIPCVDEARVYGYHEEMLHFVECVKSGTMPRENFEDGYVTNRIVDAAYRSMASGHWEDV